MAFKQDGIQQMQGTIQQHISSLTLYVLMLLKLVVSFDSYAAANPETAKTMRNITQRSVVFLVEFSRRNP